MIKQFRFWLSLLYMIVMLVGLADETNILLFVASPPFWVTETHWFAVHVVHPSEIPVIVIGLSTLVFWFLVGALIDAVVKRQNRNKAG